MMQPSNCAHWKKIFSLCNGALWRKLNHCGSSFGVALDLPVAGTCIIFEEESNMSGMMQIRGLAERVSVPPKTIRYYEQIGLLPSPLRTEAGYRLYSEDDVARLAFIWRERALDFSLGEIKEILNCRASGAAPCPYVLSLIHRKIAAVERQVAELEKLKRELRALEREAVRDGARSVLRTGEICHILEKPRRKAVRHRVSRER
jgi:DNA-binding transcriptional MerR regulator